MYETETFQAHSDEREFNSLRQSVMGTRRLAPIAPKQAARRLDVALGATGGEELGRLHGSLISATAAFKDAGRRSG